jgi:hypothetical protein
MSGQPTDAFGNFIIQDLITGGIWTVLYAIRSGLISYPHIHHYQNAQFIVQ